MLISRSKTYSTENIQSVCMFRFCLTSFPAPLSVRFQQCQRCAFKGNQVCSNKCTWMRMQQKSITFCHSRVEGKGGLCLLTLYISVS